MDGGRGYYGLVLRDPDVDVSRDLAASHPAARRDGRRNSGRAYGARVVEHDLKPHAHIETDLAGVPAKFVAEQLGTSLAMLQKHYGKFMPTTADNLDSALGLSGTVPEKSGNRRATPGRSRA